VPTPPAPSVTPTAALLPTATPGQDTYYPSFELVIQGACDTLDAHGNATVKLDLSMTSTAGRQPWMTPVSHVDNIHVLLVFAADRKPSTPPRDANGVLTLVSVPDTTTPVRDDSGTVVRSVWVYRYQVMGGLDRESGNGDNTKRVSVTVNQDAGPFDALIAQDVATDGWVHRTANTRATISTSTGSCHAVTSPGKVILPTTGADLEDSGGAIDTSASVTLAILRIAAMMGALWMIFARRR